MAHLPSRRWLYIAHRWAGIVLCLLMAMWFVSGVVMMYVGYPKLTPAERLAHLPDLALPPACCVSPVQAVAAARAAAAAGPAAPAPGRRRAREEQPVDVRLAMIGATPHWLVSDGRRQTAVHAVSGIAVERANAVVVNAAAQAFAPDKAVRLVETARQDIFTVSRALDPHRPLHRFAVDDADGTELWVSSRTGEIVRESTRLERGWNWLGAVLHWFYPLKGEFFDPLRSDIIIYTSLGGTILAVLGLVVGIWRWRFRGRYASGRSTPYREPWMRWHHITGIVFGVVTLTWILSGLLSLNPWRVFETDAPRPDHAALAGIALERATLARTPAEVIAQAGFPVRELTVRLFDGRAWYIAASGSGTTRIVPADGGGTMDAFPLARIEQLAARLLPGHAVSRTTLLTGYDNYYYAREPHTMTGHVERRLPMLRVEYADPHATWVHLDPWQGRIYNRIDDVGRLRRWLFAFLHSFDAVGFVDSRPLWDIVLIALSIGGTALTVSGVVIGWRRLRRPRPASV